jgi:hypothetical protein
MSNKKTPGEVLNSVAEGINAGDLNSLMMLYEANACFASQPGQLAKGHSVELDLMVILLVWLPNLQTFCVIRPMELGGLS